MDDVENFKIIFDHLLKQWPAGENNGKTEIQKFEYFKNEKTFLDEIKSFFMII